MEPSSIYLKSKRHTLVFSALSLLITFGLVDLTDGQSLLSVRLNDLSKINIAINILVIYSLIQLATFWTTQLREVREVIQFRIDYYLTTGVALLAVVFFLSQIVYQNVAVYIDLELSRKIALWARFAVPVVLSSILIVMLYFFTRFVRGRMHEIYEKNRALLSVLQNEDWILFLIRNYQADTKRYLSTRMVQSGKVKTTTSIVGV